MKKSKARCSLLFFAPYFYARLDFPWPQLSAPKSPRMVQFVFIVEGGRGGGGGDSKERVFKF